MLVTRAGLRYILTMLVRLVAQALAARRSIGFFLGQTLLLNVLISLDHRHLDVRTHLDGSISLLLPGYIAGLGFMDIQMGDLESYEDRGFVDLSQGLRAPRRAQPAMPCKPVRNSVRR